MKNYLLSVFCIFAANIAAAVSIVSEPILASYTLTSIQSSPSGIIGNLKLTGEPSDKYGPDIETLKLEVYLGNENYVRVKISDPSSQRWEVPNTIVDRTVSDESEAKASTSSLYYFSYSKSPFTFTVTRQSDGATLFKSSEELVFKDQYITLGTSVSPTAKTFGLGESTRLEHSLVPGNTYTLWAADIGAQSFYSNLYGSFPYYLQLLDGQAHGALFMNSNGMDVFYSPAGDQIKFTTIGGVIDLYVFVGPSPKDVLSQYTSVVGRPALVPYWSLGFHNCRWGYKSLDEVEEVVNNYEAAGIPLEAQWMDIDYMDGNETYSVVFSLRSFVLLNYTLCE
jgi:alpha-D-xyloside xylohydrolase